MKRAGVPGGALRSTDTLGTRHVPVLLSITNWLVCTSLHIGDFLPL